MSADILALVILVAGILIALMIGLLMLWVDRMVTLLEETL